MATGSFRTPTGQVEVVGTKFDLTATDAMASVRVTRGKVRVTNPSGTVEVDTVVKAPTIGPLWDEKPKQ